MMTLLLYIYLISNSIEVIHTRHIFYLFRVHFKSQSKTHLCQVDNPFRVPVGKF